MQSDNSILYLVPSNPMLKAIGKCLRKLGKKYPIHKAIMSDALQVANSYISKGTKVIVSYGSTATLIRENTEAYVVEIQYGSFDLIRSITNALKQHERIAIVGFKQFIYNALQVEKLFKVPLRIEQIEGLDEVKPMVKRLADEGITAFIGGTVVDPAIAIGCTGVSIDADMRSIEDAVQESFRVLRLQQDKNARLGTTVAILNSISEGLVGIDLTGRITETNAIVRDFLDWDGDSPQGRHYSELLGKQEMIEETLSSAREWFGETVTVGTTMFSLNCVPVLVDGKGIGAVVTLQEPLQIQSMEQKIRKAYRAEGRTAKNTLLDVVGNSKAMDKVRELARTFARAGSTVLIYGETGTGKELLAQGIHNASPRADAPFVAINCAALPENLLESELFGYVKGAFTGATAGGKTGLFEIANSGTIFLDEIGEIPLSMQSRLLRVLQEKEIWRIGDNKTTPVDMRVIAATNRDLSAMVDAGTFREDLYYRLAVLVLNLPPLRERLSDLQQLADSIVRMKAESLNRKVRPLNNEAIELLGTLDWPGNIRQLANVLERAIVMSRGNRIALSTLKDALDSCSHYPRSQHHSEVESVVCPATPVYSLGPVTDETILRTLSQYKGSRKATAEALGISGTTLWRRINAMKNKA